MKVQKGLVTLALATAAIVLTLPAYAEKVFVYNPRTTTWYAYEDGELVNSGEGSGGADYCRDLHRRCHSPAGVYYVYRKGGPGCKSSKFPLPYGGAPMPYCMYFHGGYAIHGSWEVPEDYNASHGCIRIHPEAAKWLSQNFIDIGTKVVIKPY